MLENEVISQICTVFPTLFHGYCDYTNMNVIFAHHECFLTVLACRCVKSTDHNHSLGRQGSTLCSAHWAFVLEKHPTMSKLKYCPLCTVPEKVKEVEAYHPGWDVYTFNFSKSDVAQLLGGVQGLTTAKHALAGLKLPHDVKRKLP
jgi:hypothetical protein